MAVHLELHVGRRRVVGQHHVQLVQHQVGQQVGHFAVVTHQPQVGHAQHRLQQAAHLQLGQSVGNAHCQPH